MCINSFIGRQPHLLGYILSVAAVAVVAELGSSGEACGSQSLNIYCVNEPPQNTSLPFALDEPLTQEKDGEATRGGGSIFSLERVCHSFCLRFCNSLRRCSRLFYLKTTVPQAEAEDEVKDGGICQTGCHLLLIYLFYWEFELLFF